MRKTSHSWPALAVLALAVALAAAPAPAADLAEMKAELTKVEDEIKVVETKLTANAAEQQQIKTDSAHLQSESDALQARIVAHEANRPAVASVCSGTVPPEQLAAAQARCDAQRLPFNQVVERQQKERQALIDRNEALVRKDNRRLAAARELTQQYEKLSARKQQLQKVILAASGSRCIQSCQAIPCTTLNCDALKQCEQNCWDGARGAGSTPAVEPYVTAPFVMKPRTPQEAIDDYRRSGPARPGPSGLRTRAPPLPPLQPSPPPPPPRPSPPPSR